MSRRDVIGSGGLAMGFALAGTLGALGQESAQGKAKEEVKVTPAEDLMFEHGIIERLLLIYDEAARRINAGPPVPAKFIFDTASIVRSFGEDYHEKLEEQYIFPRLEKAGQHAELVRALRTQHETGREITTGLLDMTKAGTLDQPQQAAEAMRSFYRMYIPHISRENSVAFRAFRQLVPDKEYVELGEQFEDKEHSLFGEEGFEKMVERVVAIEKSLGIYDLAHLTASR